MEKNLKIDDVLNDLAVYFNMLENRYDILSEEEKNFIIIRIHEKVNIIEDYVRMCRKDIQQVSYEANPNKRRYLLQKVCANLEFVSDFLIRNEAL